MDEGESQIPRTRFVLDAVPVAERYDFWRDSIACVFSVEADPELRGACFDAEVDAVLLGPLMMARTRTVSQWWRRASQDIARDGMDHYMVQLFEQGTTRFEDHDQQMMPMNGLVVFDLARSSSSFTTDMTNLSLIIPRPLLEGKLTQPDDLHRRFLREDQPMVVLVREHMLSLFEQAKRMSWQEAHLVAPPTVALIAACLNAETVGTGSVPGGTSGELLQQRIRRYIEMNLEHRDLGPEKICSFIGLSRSRLYRMFEPLGGVVRYIRERRLHRALCLLSNPASASRTIYEIALRCGFGSDTDFSRSFKRRYGMTPRDVKSGIAVSQPVVSFTDAVDRRYEHWLNGISIASPEGGQSVMVPNLLANHAPVR